MNPWIASKVLDLIMRLPIDDKSREIQKVVRRCRASDSIPKIKAVSFLMELSEFDIAASIMDGMSVRNNISQWEYWRGLICKETGDLSLRYRISSDHMMQTAHSCPYCPNWNP